MATHEDATALFYASTDIFDKMMDCPTLYGFDSKDVQKSGGSMWVDHVHPTSLVHEFLANDLAEFLTSLDSTSEPVM